MDVMDSIHCGQLILRKICKTGATRCQILKLQCTKFDFCYSFTPDPTGGAYSTHPDINCIPYGLFLRKGKRKREVR